MEVEHDIKVIPFNEKTLPGEIERLAKEGWMIVPGVQPIVIYHLVRQKNAHVVGNSAHGTLSIDDSKIGILRDGKLIS